MVHWIFIPACLFTGALLTVFTLALCRASEDERK